MRYRLVLGLGVSVGLLAASFGCSDDAGGGTNESAGTGGRGVEPTGGRSPGGGNNTGGIAEGGAPEGGAPEGGASGAGASADPGGEAGAGGEPSGPWMGVRCPAATGPVRPYFEVPGTQKGKPQISSVCRSRMTSVARKTGSTSRVTPLPAWVCSASIRSRSTSRPSKPAIAAGAPTPRRSFASRARSTRTRSRPARRFATWTSPMAPRNTAKSAARASSSRTSARATSAATGSASACSRVIRSCRGTPTPCSSRAMYARPTVRSSSRRRRSPSYWAIGSLRIAPWLRPVSPTRRFAST